MGLFSAHTNPTNGPEVMKSEVNVENYERNSDISSAARDEADMARMGKRQETRVSQSTCLSRIRELY